MNLYPVMGIGVRCSHCGLAHVGPCYTWLPNAPETSDAAICKTCGYKHHGAMCPATYGSEITALKAQILDLTVERDRALEWRDHDKERAEKAEEEISALRMAANHNHGVAEWNGSVVKDVRAEATRLRRKVKRLKRKVQAAYQIVGNLALVADTFDTPDVQRALDYLSGSKIKGPILPWPRREIQRAEAAPRPSTHGPQHDHSADAAKHMAVRGANQRESGVGRHE